MQTTLTCPSCDQRLRIDADRSATAVRCPGCRTVIQLPPKPGPAMRPQSPPPESQDERLPAPAGRTPVPLIGAVVLAAFASAGAIALPLIGQHGLPAYAAGGLGLALGLAAVTLSALARGRLLGLAGTCVLLAAGSVLLALNDARAEEAPARAEAALKKAQEAEARAEEAPEKAARLLEQVKAEQDKLDTKRDQFAAEKAGLAAERGKIEEEKGKVEEERKQAEASKQAAADLSKKAEGDKLRAQETLDKAEQKEKDAQELQKKVKEALDGVKGQVKSKQPQDRKAAIAALARLGELAASADYGVGASTSRTVLCQYVPNTVGYNIPKADPLGGLLMSKQSVKPIVVGPW